MLNTKLWLFQKVLPKFSNHRIQFNMVYPRRSSFLLGNAQSCSSDVREPKPSLSPGNNFHVNTYVCFRRSQIIVLLNYLKFSVSFSLYVSLSNPPHHINACFLLTAQTQICVNFNVHCKIKGLFCLRRCISTF